jgi:RNA polymerase sigma factor (sigma-70 family)
MLECAAGMTRELASYEGLVFRTAQMYAPLVDDDEDDVRQELRITAWKALASYRGRSAEIPDLKGRTPRDKYVFMCVSNRVKDLLKKKKRPEDFIEDRAPDAVRRERFDAQHLSVDESAYVEAIIDGDVVLPSTLDLMEIQVVRLLLQDLNQTEIARHLGVTRTKVREAHASVKLKMADWGTDASEREEARQLQAAA